MAENSKGGILNKADKFLRRRKTKVLQSLGKTGRTTDEKLAEDCQRLDRQQEIGHKFQKDLRHYIHSAKALSVAAKTFYTTVSETYEPEWENHEQITEILTNMDMLWQDYLQKLQDQVQDPLAKYLSHIPQIKARVAKQSRKLIDYDNARHNLEVLQNAKKKDDAKIAKAQEDLDQAKKIYEDLNNEVHQELPEFYRSRVRFYGNVFQSLFSAETVFQTEAGKGSQTMSDSSEKLAKDHDQDTYTPRKRTTMTIGSDENLANGHEENGPETVGGAPDTPSPIATPTTQEPVTNGNREADTSKESIDDEAYEPTAFDKKEDDAKVEQETSSTEKDEPETPDTEEEQTNEDVQSQQAAKPDAEKEESEVTTQKEEEPKVNGDLDTLTSTDQEVPEDSPPPPPTSLPPSDIVDDDNKEEDGVKQEKKKDEDGEKKEKKEEDSDEDQETKGDGVDEELYQVPPPAKPVDDDDIPPGYLFTVTATHAYKGEDDDELTFDAHEVIYVVEYEDPEEQDPGWLMGIRKLNRTKGVFPENFTKRVSEGQHT